MAAPRVRSMPDCARSCQKRTKSVTSRFVIHAMTRLSGFCIFEQQQYLTGLNQNIFAQAWIKCRSGLFSQKRDFAGVMSNVILQQLALWATAHRCFGDIRAFLCGKCYLKARRGAGVPSTGIGGLGTFSYRSSSTCCQFPFHSTRRHGSGR